MLQEDLHLVFTATACHADFFLALTHYTEKHSFLTDG